MKARLFCRVGELSGVEQAVTGETTVGRGRENQLVLDSSGISEHHARIRHDVEQGCWMLDDLGSTNGTELDGIRVKRPQRLHRLHVITFAQTHSFIFQDLEAYGAPAPKAVEVPKEGKESPPAKDKTIVGEVLEVPRLGQSTGVHEQVVVPPPALQGAAKTAPSPAPPVFCLEVEIEGEWKRHILQDGENVVGRVGAAITIPTPDVSRRHARLTVQGREVVLEDLGSTNKTYLEGIRLKTAVPIELEAKISFGGTKARLVRG